MKILILAFDGLEYNFVVKWNLKNLMQTKYGRLKVGEQFFHESQKVPLTPKVWGSFITGKKPSEHGVNKFWTYGKMENLRFLPVIRHIKNKRKLLWRIGIKPRILNKKDLKAETLFDIIKPSIAIDVPTYNLPSETQFNYVKALYLKGVNHYIKVAWKTFNKRRQTLFRKINRNWKLLMAYFSIADAIGHACIIKHPNELVKAYFTLDKLVESVKRQIENEQRILLVVVSDHGIKQSEDRVTGNHSDHAFWSLNIETDWEPKDMRDFYPKILEWARNA